MSLPADRTAKLSLREATARGHAAPPSKFVWPAPPYYEFTGSGSQSSECLVVYRDGRKATGTLEEFLPDESQFGFRATDATQPLRIAFSSILRLQLVQPVALRSQAVPTPHPVPNSAMVPLRVAARVASSRPVSLRQNDT